MTEIMYVSHRERTWRGFGLDLNLMSIEPLMSNDFDFDRVSRDQCTKGVALAVGHPLSFLVLVLGTENSASLLHTKVLLYSAKRSRSLCYVTQCLVASFGGIWTISANMAGSWGIQIDVFPTRDLNLHSFLDDPWLTWSWHCISGSDRSNSELYLQLHYKWDVFKWNVLFLNRNIKTTDCVLRIK